jgi:hypothetical protein
MAYESLVVGRAWSRMAMFDDFVWGLQVLSSQTHLDFDTPPPALPVDQNMLDNRIDRYLAAKSLCWRLSGRPDVS